MARKNLLRELMAAPAPDAATPDAPAGKVDGRQPGEPPLAAGAGGPPPSPDEVDGRQLSAPGASAPPSPPPLPSHGAARGAIGAVGRSIADLKARALVDLDPALIDPGGLVDRLGEDPEDAARLLASIREHGQQVPVLARPHPGIPGRYQIVYGRRRAAALAALGRPVRALVRALDDRDLVLAQGQENSARRDLSFIEKASFARAMLAAGYDRATAQAALSTDKTQISRMLSVTDRLPEAVIAAIGPAHGIGRDRWCVLAEVYAALGVTEARARAVVRGNATAQGEGAPGEGRAPGAGLEAGPETGLAPETAEAPVGNAPGVSSEARFEALETWLRDQARARAVPPRPRRSTRRGAAPEASLATAPPEVLRAADGAEIAVLLRRPDRLALLLDAEGQDFGDWLIANLPALHLRWRAGKATPRES